LGAPQTVGDLLSGAGHQVSTADPPYGESAFLSSAVRALAGVAAETSSLGIRLSELERRIRPSVVIGRTLRRPWLIRTAEGRRWRESARTFFERYDVLITPTIADVPIKADGWSQRGFIANMKCAPFAPYTSVWNAAGYPAAAVPVARPDGGLPLSVQLIAPIGGEHLLLQVAKQLELLLPWSRHSPLATRT
jgi:amidase